MLLRMASSLLAALVCLALAGQQVGCFDREKLYGYEFEATILTRVLDEERPAQYAGVGIRSPLVVKQSGPKELTVKFTDPQMVTINEPIANVQEVQLQKMEPKPMENAAGLNKAFRIYYDEDNAVRAFDSYKEEPKWVTNFKRGLLSFFQLKLEPGYYTTTEKSVFGECDTDYLVMGAGQSPSSMNVTKTRNMVKCKTRFHHQFMPIDSTECYDNERDLQQYKHSNAIFNIQLQGTTKDYEIVAAQLEESSTYSPFGPKAHSHLVQTRAQLKLVSGQQQLSAPQVEDGAQITESLSYDPPEMLNFYANVNLEEDHHLSNIYGVRASVDQVMQVFDALTQEHRAYTGAFESGQFGGDEAGAALAPLFIRLNELVGTMNLAKIEQLYEQVDRRGDAHKKVFWDLMSVVGTNPSFVFMKKLITEGEAPSVKIKEFLTRLSFHIKSPSKSLFDEYVNLCKSDKLQSNQQYKRLCSLPLASLIHQHCAKPHAKYLRAHQEGTNGTSYKKAQNTCQLATAEEYFTRLVGSASSPSGPNGDSELSLGDRMLNIKMAGELGVKPSIDYLLEYVRNRDEHPSLRAAAMWNLNKVARLYPMQVKRLVVPFYHDQDELLEVRLAAFYNWFQAGLSLHELETLAKQLQVEPSRQLVVYMHSMIKSLAEFSPLPCSKSMDKDAKLVLPMVKRALKNHSPPSMLDSQVSITSNWLPDYGYGTTTMMSAIFSNDSMAPTNLFYHSSEIMTGIRLSPMSVSVQAHGLDKLIKRVAGIQGLWADKESFLDVFSLKRRTRRQVAAAELIKQEANEIDKELKLSTREFSDIYLAVTVSVYGRPVNFIDRDSRELKKMLSEDGTIKIPQIKKLLHSFNNHTAQQMVITFEKLAVFNNELGLPLYSSINNFDHKTFKLNTVKLDVEPAFFKDERQGKPPTKLGVALDAKVGRHNEMFVATGLLLVGQRQQTGAGFHKKKLVSLPLKMAIEVSPLENKVQVRRQPIHDNILFIRQQPATFVRSYDPQLAPPTAPANRSIQEWRPLYELQNTQHMSPFKMEYMTPLALGLKLEGKHRAGEDWSMAAWRRYLAKVGMQEAKFLYFFSPSGAPLELRLSTVTTQENPTKELTSVIAWRHHHPEESSGLELSETERELETTTKAGGQPGKPSTVSYKLALLGGSTKERRVAIDLAYSRSWDRLLHKWRISYQRTPLDQAAPSAEVTNLCWNGQMQFPKYQVDRLLKFDLLDMDHRANASSELTFGDECREGKLDQAPSKVSAKVVFDWSQELREMIQAALSPNPSANLTAQQMALIGMYRRCLRQREQGGGPLESSCLHLLRRMTQLTHLDATFDYKDVPERWTKLVSRLGSLYTYARAGYIDEIEDNRRAQGDYYKSSDGKQDRAYLDANMTSSSVDRKLSYHFHTPNYQVTYKNLPISIPPLSTFPLLSASYYQSLQRSATHRICSVSGNQVTTFDNLTYTMPSVGDGCFKLIAKDCSPEANFVVLGAKIGSGKVVKVYVKDKFKIEFVPDKEGKRISEIKVNGETVNIENGKEPLSRDITIGAKSVESFNIENNGAYYTLSSKLYKFSVNTDGTWILVQQSKYYAGKSCGICGDANGDHLLEFKSPSSAKKICKNANDFVWAYVLPSTCASKPATIACA